MSAAGDTAAAAAWSAQARQRLTTLRAELAQRFADGENVDALTSALCRAVDALVVQAWQHCVAAEVPATLLAVGGYGQGTLFPQSDIDLLVLAEPAVQQDNEAAFACLFTLLWDAGLAPGHAVRSAAQCTQAARDDITVQTALQDARWLAGDSAGVAALAAAIAAPAVWPPTDYFQAKRQELRQRHARFGNTADNLEPNIKESPGGLRDLQTLQWMARRVSGARDLQAMIASGQLGQDEWATLERARGVLARMRWGLHQVVGRREERLRFDHQKALAELLGFHDDVQALAVEQMMQDFYRGAALVQRIGERVLQRFEEQLLGPAEIVALQQPGFGLQSGYLRAIDPQWPATLDAVFALFACWATLPTDTRLHSVTARALAEALPRIPACDAAAPTEREAFIALLRGAQPVRTVERMAQLGVLARWIPAFANVTGRMQFDLFHMFTVDQHTLAVLRNLELFAGEVRDPRFGFAHEVWPLLHKPELQLLAALFHDIGKGRGGDHAELGAEDAAQFCRLHGLSDADTALVEWLVRHHLLMSITAQKQDIGDPDVVHAFAQRVRDREHLDHLYLLTCADIAGTSPKLWNAWKDRLLTDLYTATRLALRRGLEHRVARAERLQELQAAARTQLTSDGLSPAAIDAALALIPETSMLRTRAEQIAWQAGQLAATSRTRNEVYARSVDGSGALELFVLTPDRAGLFAALVITLDRLGLSIHRAAALDAPDGRVFDHFEVLPHDLQRLVAPELVVAKLRKMLDQPNVQVHPTRRRVPAHLRHFRIPTQIDFTAASDGSLLSLVCTDRIGLLADIAHVLRSVGARVHDARIATFGERAEDVFRLTDAQGGPLSSSTQQLLRERLLTTLDPESSP